MSDRLARIANGVARRTARGRKVDEWKEVKGVLPASDPWAAIPEEARQKTVETLPDGTVMTTYTGTLEEHHRAAHDPEPEPKEPEQEAAKAAPAPKKPKPSEGGRFAEYPMPGHERT